MTLNDVLLIVALIALMAVTILLPMAITGDIDGIWDGKDSFL